MVEITTTEQNKEQRMKRKEDSLRDPWDDIKCTSIHIIGVPEGEEREKGHDKIFEEIIPKSSLTWERKHSLKSRKHRVPYRISPRRNTLRHILIKLTKIKDKEELFFFPRFFFIFLMLSFFF